MRKAPRIQWPTVFTGLRGLTWADFPREISAGITLAALIIPLNIGYAQVAGMPPVFGLYAGIVPLVIFAVFTSSRHVVGSPDAPIAAILGAVLIGFAPIGDPLRVYYALALALMCGLDQKGVGVLGTLPSGLPSLTLTNYAADNSKLSIKTLMKDNLVNAEIGIIDDEQATLNRILCCTVHSFAFRQLLRYSRANGFKGFIVANECNEEILDDILEDIKPAWRDDKSIKAALLDTNHRHVKDAEEISGLIHNKYPEYTDHTKTFIRILQSLEQKKSEDNIITYDDMVHRFFKILHSRRIREQMFREFPVIIVDEFQDTGSLQWEVIKKMVGPKSKLLCAGDDGQTIFTWTGASFDRFTHFKIQYPDCDICYTISKQNFLPVSIRLDNIVRLAVRSFRSMIG